MGADGTLVIFVRHGETDGNKSLRFQLPSEALSPTGLRQAHLLGKWFGTAVQQGLFRVTTLLSSDYDRALQTASGIQGGLGAARAELRTTPWLQERSFGDLQGLLYRDVVREHGPVFGEHFAPPGGETRAEFRSRVELAWSHVLENAAELAHNPGEAEPALVVVTHGLVLEVLCESGMFPGQQRTKFGNTSMTCLRILQSEEGKEAQVVVTSLNETPHFDDSLLRQPPLRPPLVGLESEGPEVHRCCSTFQTCLASFGSVGA